MVLAGRFVWFLLKHHLHGCRVYVEYLHSGEYVKLVKCYQRNHTDLIFAGSGGQSRGFWGHGTIADGAHNPGVCAHPTRWKRAIFSCVCLCKRCHQCNIQPVNFIAMSPILVAGMEGVYSPNYPVCTHSYVLSSISCINCVYCICIELCIKVWSFCHHADFSWQRS